MRHAIWAFGVVGVCGALAVLLGGPVVLRVFRRAHLAGRTGVGTLRGGAWIGRLERLVIYAAIIAGKPEGIAFVLALKGLGRYPELRSTPDNPQLQTEVAEKFIIGTLVSGIVAAAFAFLAVWLKKLL